MITEIIRQDYDYKTFSILTIFPLKCIILGLTTLWQGHHKVKLTEDLHSDSKLLMPHSRRLASVRPKYTGNH